MLSKRIIATGMFALILGASLFLLAAAPVYCEVQEDPADSQTNSGSSIAAEEDLMAIGTAVDLKPIIKPSESKIEYSETTETQSSSPVLKTGAGDTAVNMSSGGRLSMDLSLFFEGDSQNFAYTAASNTEYVKTYVSGYMLELVPQEGWSGDATITITAYNDGGSQSLDISVCVLFTNHPPSLIKPLGTAEFNQGGENRLDLADYFRDRDSDLEYVFTGAEHITLEIEGSILAICADWCWYGSEEILVTATDGTYSVQSLLSVKINPVWMPFKYPEAMMNPRETTKDIPLSTITDTPISDVRVSSDNPMVQAEVVNGVIIITPREGWTGEAAVEVNILSADGQVGSIIIPITVSERVRPVMAWVVNYAIASIVAAAFISFKLYGQSKAASKASPVDLRNYRHYRYRE